MNKKNILVAFVGLAISSVAIFSCGKDDKKTKTELISAHNWKITKSANQDPSACLADDRFIFNANGSTSQLTGNLHCNQNEAQNIVGQWNFTPGEDSIFFSFKGATAKLNKLTDDSLIVQTTINNNAVITAFAKP